MSYRFKYPTAISQVLEIVRDEDHMGMLDWLQGVLFNDVYKTFGKLEGSVSGGQAANAALDYIRTRLEQVKQLEYQTGTTQTC